MSPASGKRDAPVRSHHQLGLQVGPAGKVHRDLVAFAQAVLFVDGGLKVAQSLEGVGLQLRGLGLLGPGVAVRNPAAAFRPAAATARALPRTNPRKAIPEDLPCASGDSCGYLPAPKHSQAPAAPPEFLLLLRVRQHPAVQHGHNSGHVENAGGQQNSRSLPAVHRRHQLRHRPRQRSRDQRTAQAPAQSPRAGSASAADGARKAPGPSARRPSRRLPLPLPRRSRAGSSGLRSSAPPVT